MIEQPGKVFGSAASIAVEYLPFVHRLARRFIRRLPPHVGFEDLVGAGVVGLLEAIARFDAQRPTDFATYAEFRIKGAILDELRRGDLMARDARRSSKQIEQVLERLHQTLGRLPEEDEIAAALQIDVPALRTRLERLVPVRVTSLDDVVLQADRTASPLDQATKTQLCRRLSTCIARLPARQQRVLHLYYREELTLREIGCVLDVSESRVCQILAAITLQLRALFRSKAANDSGVFDE